jgi:hypothetical protein
VSRADGLVNHPHAAFTLEATDKIDRALLYVELNLFLGPIAIEDTHLVSDHQLHHFPHAVLFKLLPLYYVNACNRARKCSRKAYITSSELLSKLLKLNE